MNRILLVLLLLSACFIGCKKTNDGVAIYKAQAAVDDKIVSNYLKTNGIPELHVDTSGVCYKIDTLGSGNDLYTSSTQVTVGYVGSLLTTGKVFGQTDKFHPSYTLGSVILGWQLGIPQVKKGGTVTIYLPSRYAYGPYAQPNLGLPAHAILIFTIKVYNVTN
ncbi:FKBP-type peptidyl-prolyl cis-trans isomerase [Mucilaginibacter sp.]|uniref:FKBP-type peptidyl-prolyl cis-trans isomerase n=1 Tax=Mucilaginibacter sp. TaxID=1882438 RepID=UPI003D0EE5D2